MPAKRQDGPARGSREADVPRRENRQRAAEPLAPEPGTAAPIATRWTSTPSSPRTSSVIADLVEAEQHVAAHRGRPVARDALPRREPVPEARPGVDRAQRAGDLLQQRPARLPPRPPAARPRCTTSPGAPAAARTRSRPARSRARRASRRARSGDRCRAAPSPCPGGPAARSRARQRRREVAVRDPLGRTGSDSGSPSTGASAAIASRSGSLSITLPGGSPPGRLLPAT